VPATILFIILTIQKLKYNQSLLLFSCHSVVLHFAHSSTSSSRLRDVINCIGHLSCFSLYELSVYSG